MKLISEQNKRSAQWLGGILLLAAISGCGGSEESASTSVTTGDPLYVDQWHLKNTAQFVGARSGEDINVEPVWAGTAGNNGAVKGQGVLVAVVDDGLQLAHEDLVANVAVNKSWDYADRDTDPTSTLLYHGTNVAGLIAARDLNGLGVRGVAPRASLAGYNLLSDDYPLTTDIYDALTRNHIEVDVSNNSWGLAIDELGEAEPPTDNLWHLGIEEGISSGRDGKGIIYVWSAGNGGSDGQDNSNYDYQTNNRHVISVCAVDGRGRQADYSEPGANIWLCAPGGDDVFVSGGWTRLGPPTTDLKGSAGGNPATGLADDYTDQSYTRGFVGTSASAPIVSGVVALVLEANPNLGWRDVRLILAETARKNDAVDSDWSVTSPASGQPQYNINHKYGFGVVDAAAAVGKASGWSNVGDQVIVEKTVSTATSIPDNSSIGIQQSINLDAVADGNLIVEYVELDFSSDHQYSGDLEIILTAPSGTKSVLAETHDCLYLDNFGNLQTRFGSCFYDYNPWTFGSGRHLGEGSAGTWRLNVADKGNAGAYGQLQSWTLRIYGRTQ